jgi:hypothetical protein
MCAFSPWKAGLSDGNALMCVALTGLDHIRVCVSTANVLSSELSSLDFWFAVGHLAA